MFNDIDKDFYRNGYKQLNNLFTIVVYSRYIDLVDGGRIRALHPNLEN